MISSHPLTADDPPGCAEALPGILAESRPLAEAHRLDLALCVVLEETSVRIAEALVRVAPNAEARRFLALQIQEDGRHLGAFRRRLDRSLAVRPTPADATQALLLRVLGNGSRVAGGNPEPPIVGGAAGGLRSEEVVAAVVVPPLRRFLDCCRVQAEEGSFSSGLALLDLVLKGAASPLSAFEARFWEPVDPSLASLIRAADEEDRQHVLRATEVVRSLGADDPGRRPQISVHCQEARVLLAEAFRYYARKLVGLLAAVRRNYPERYAGVEIAGVRSSPDEQLATILAASEAGCSEALREAGLDGHG